MRILVVAVGSRMPQWVEAGFDEYARRMPRDARIELLEIKAEKRGPGITAERIVVREAQRIEVVLPAACTRIVLDERGKMFRSSELARQLSAWRSLGKDIAFLIGGADGLSPKLKATASALLALSALTLPHGLVRVLLAEQLYRAHTINSGHPYHRE